MRFAGMLLSTRRGGGRECYDGRASRTLRNAKKILELFENTGALAGNTGMHALAHAFGFQLSPDTDGTVQLMLRLRD